MVAEGETATAATKGTKGMDKLMDRLLRPPTDVGRHEFRPSATSSPTPSRLQTMLATPEPAQLEDAPIAVPLHDVRMTPLVLSQSKFKKHCKEVAGARALLAAAVT